VQEFIVTTSHPNWTRGVNKVITRATETRRNKMVSMSAGKRRFAADSSTVPRFADTPDRRF